MSRNLSHLRIDIIKDQITERIQANQDAYSNSLSWTFRSGKYAGKPITAVPTSYLAWMRKNANIGLAERCAAEVERRDRIRHNQIANAFLVHGD